MAYVDVSEEGAGRSLGVYALGSIGVSLLVLGLKYFAYRITGSVALYSDALEAIVNVVTAVIVWIALSVSSRPPDATHNFGHGKAEYLSAVLEGVLIIVAAAAILREAAAALRTPRGVDAPFAGLAISLGATAINALWATVLVRAGAKRHSPALAADGRHLFSDVITSVGVVAGVGLAAVTGWAILDPLLAIGVAILILRSGWQVVKSSTGGLMDAALPAEERRAIERLIEDNRAGSIEAHGLRTRRAGRTVLMSFHLVVDRHMEVGAAHAICDRIEAAICVAFADSIVSIHVEPDDKRHPAAAITAGRDDPGG